VRRTLAADAEERATSERTRPSQNPGSLYRDSVQSTAAFSFSSRQHRRPEVERTETCRKETPPTERSCAALKRRLGSGLAGAAAAVELGWDLISNAVAGMEAGASVGEPRLCYGLVIHVSQKASTAELANTSVCGRTSPIAAVPSTMMLASRHGTIAAVVRYS
jgi:hypothetical protein